MTHPAPVGHRGDESFVDAIGKWFDFDVLAAHPSSVIGLRQDFSIAYVNAAWDEFARQNDGAATLRTGMIGEDYRGAIAAPLLPFYSALFATAAAAPDELKPVSHEYECSSAEVFRKFCMHIYVLPADRCFMVVHSLVESRPHDSADRPTCAGDDSRFRDTRGLIHQCAHCRRIQRTREPDHWDWVPEWVRKCPVGTSHTLCPVCDLYFYPMPDNAPT